MLRFILAALLLPSIALAQAWPERPVRIIVPFPPGGGTEAVARLVAAHYQEVFGQPFVVESRSGASGMLGTEQAAPAGTPPAIIQRLNTEGRRFAQSPRERERIVTQGGVVMDLSPQQFREFLQTEITAWGEVIRAGNIRVE